MKKKQVIELSIKPGELIAETVTKIEAAAEISIVVPPSCEGICVSDGSVVGVFAEGKTVVAETKEKGFFARLFSKKAESPIIHIYCINKSVPLKGYWGTANRIEFKERETGIPVSAGLSGTYKATVDDSARLLRNLLGLGKNLNIDAIDEYFSDEIGAVVRDKFYKIVIENDIPFFELAGDLAKLANLIKVELSNVFSDSGLKVTSFIIENVGLDDDVKEMVRESAVKSYKKRMSEDETREQRDAEERRYQDNRDREMWLREEARASRTSAAEIEYARVVAQQGTKDGEEPRTYNARERFCSKCGAHVMRGVKFCPNCGQKQKAVCVCGYEATGDEKFCPNCGKELA